jgi:hypothetical protein
MVGLESPAWVRVNGVEVRSQAWDTPGPNWQYEQGMLLVKGNAAPQGVLDIVIGD